jgi:phospholipid/cholesterol/gamma-HCH transport system substrate-binding protein
VAVVVVVALLMFGRGGGYDVAATFENAGQLVKGNYVEVGGRPIGKIKSIALDEDGSARLKMTVGQGFDPLHEGTTARIRATSLSGIANRYVELHPGPNDAKKIPDGGLIGADRTQAPVELDQLFNTLDPKTRKGLQDIIQGSATQYDGRAREAAESFRYLNPALSSSSRLTNELIRDRVTFKRFVKDTAQTVSAIAERKGELGQAVRNSAATARAIGDENVALARALGLLPGTLRRANTTFVNLRATLDDLDTLVDESKPATKDLAKLFRRLRPLVADARPTIRDLRLLIRRQGPNNDLIELTGKMPRLARIAKNTFPHNIEALQKAQPVIEYIRPYSPDLTGWITKFGQAASSYDANGHYARIQPIFNQFQYTETPLGPVLDAAPLETRGREGLQYVKPLRCPGGATQPPPDGSAPWRDSDGDLQCDPTAVPPGP